MEARLKELMPRSLTLVWDQVFPLLLLALVLQAAEPQTSALERGSRNYTGQNKTIALGWTEHVL